MYFYGKHPFLSMTSIVSNYGTNLNDYGLIHTMRYYCTYNQSEESEQKRPVNNHQATNRSTLATSLNTQASNIFMGITHSHVLVKR